MAYEFKKLSDVEVVAEPTESANVLIEEDGVIKKAPKTAVGGDGKIVWDGVISNNSHPIYMARENITITDFDFTTIKKKVLNGEDVVIMLHSIFSYGNIYEVWSKSNSIAYDSTADQLIVSWINPRFHEASAPMETIVTIAFNTLNEIEEVSARNI